MINKNEVYKCEVCGNVVEALCETMGEMSCCGKVMILKQENIIDGAVEKHVPIVMVQNDKIIVKVGEIDHPMTSDHYIEWIELITKDKVYRQFLKPGDRPEAVFDLVDKVYTVRAYCNLHGLWKSN